MRPPIGGVHTRCEAERVVIINGILSKLPCQSSIFAEEIYVDRWWYRFGRARVLRRASALFYRSQRSPYAYAPDPACHEVMRGLLSR